MNLRQKAKKYKMLAELYGAKTIQPQIIYQESKTIHLRNASYVDPYIETIDMTIERNNNELLEEVRHMIVVEVTDDTFTDKKIVNSDIWVVDRKGV